MKRLITLIVFHVLLQDGVRCIPLDQFYPFGETVNDTLLFPNDDRSSPPINLTLIFPFFDEDYETVYVRTV